MDLIEDELSESAALTGGQGAPAILGWTTSGVFTSTGDLVLADPVRGTLARVAYGRAVQTVDRLDYIDDKVVRLGQDKEAQDKEAFEFWMNMPWYVHATRDGGYLLGKLERTEDDETDNQILFVNREGRIERFFRTVGPDAVDPETNENVISTGVFRAAPMGPGAFTVGDVHVEGDRRDSWTTFAYMDENDFELFSIDLKSEEDDRDLMQDLGNIYYSRGFALITTLGDTGYVLVMEEQPWIGTVTRGDTEVRELVDLSEYSLPYIENVSGLPRLDMMRFYRDVYRTIEDHAMPIGLFVAGDQLFVLIKSKANSVGRTFWAVRKLMEKNQLGPEIPLPEAINSESVILVSGTGPNVPLAAIQKGPISMNRGGGLPPLLHRSVRSAVYFDLAWLSDEPHIRSKTACARIPIRPTSF